MRRQPAPPPLALLLTAHIQESPHWLEHPPAPIPSTPHRGVTCSHPPADGACSHQMPLSTLFVDVQQLPAKRSSSWQEVQHHWLFPDAGAVTPAPRVAHPE